MGTVKTAANDAEVRVRTHPELLSHSPNRAPASPVPKTHKLTKARVHNLLWAVSHPLSSVFSQSRESFATDIDIQGKKQAPCAFMHDFCLTGLKQESQKYDRTL